MLIKPPMWNVSLGLVAPEFRGLWDNSLILAVPFLGNELGQYNYAPRQQDPYAYSGDPTNTVRVVTPAGPGVTFDSYSSRLAYAIGSTSGVTGMSFAVVVWIINYDTYWRPALCSADNDDGWAFYPAGDTTYPVFYDATGLNEVEFTGMSAGNGTWLCVGRFTNGSQHLHMKNLATGVIQSESRSDTIDNAVFNQGPSQPLGIGGSSSVWEEFFNDAVVSACVWERELTDSEIGVLLADPFGLFHQFRQVPLPLMYRHSLRGR